MAWVVPLLQALRARRGGFLPHHRRDDGVPRDGESDQVRSAPTCVLSRALLSCGGPHRFCSPLVLALSSRVRFFACWHVLTTHREFSLAVSAKLAVILTVPCVSAQQH